MRILQFIETGGPGGAENAVLHISQALKNKGHDIHVITTREGWLTTQLDKQQIQRQLIPSYRSFDFGLILKIVSYVKKHNIQIIHSHLLDSNTYCSVAAKIAGIPCVATEHGDIHHTKKKKFSRYKIKLISRFAKKIIAVSDFSKHALISAGMNKEKIIILGNPIALSPYTSQFRSRHEIHPDIPEDTWLWIHVGNLRAVKDQATLIKGFALTQISSTKTHTLLIVGEGNLKEELLQLARALKISDNIIFLGHRNDVRDILSHCNGFVLTSLSEALPISLLEAAREKLVLLCSSVGGIPEVVKENQTGYLFPAKNAAALSEKMCAILENQDEARRTAQRAHEFISEHFETNRIVQKLEKLYEDLRTHDA